MFSVGDQSPIIVLVRNYSTLSDTNVESQSYEKIVNLAANSRILDWKIP